MAEPPEHEDKSAAQVRADRRREQWSGDVVELGAKKGRLYSDLAIPDRLAAFAALNERVWALREAGIAGGERREWPSEVFEIDVHVRA